MPMPARTVTPQIFTLHARHRMAERGITEQDIQDAAAEGVVNRPAGTRRASRRLGR